jgi:hypothetical protein
VAKRPRELISHPKSLLFRFASFPSAVRRARRTVDRGGGESWRRSDALVTARRDAGTTDLSSVKDGRDATTEERAWGIVVGSRLHAPGAQSRTCRHPASSERHPASS